MKSLGEILDEMTAPGELAEKLEDNAVRCTACAHRCLVKDGRRGICQVRFNRGGELRVPWGYVAGLQADPIEKKPFFHCLPGEDALTFGMLGCDFHCDFCFPGDTQVITGKGPATLENLFSTATRIDRQSKVEIAYPEELSAVTSSGHTRPVRAIFKHAYQGELTIIRPYYLPGLRCTPDHRLYATPDPIQPPGLCRASELKKGYYLAIPRHYTFSAPQVIDVSQELGQFEITHRVRWKLSAAQRQMIMTATAQGQTSRQIGQLLGKSSSYIRHVRSKLVHGKSDTCTHHARIENGRLRFPHERQPGLPLMVPFDEDLSRLLGYYCAEGTVIQNQERPNSYSLNFSFARYEQTLAEEVCQLLERCLGVKARKIERPTTLGVTCGKVSTALLFHALVGRRSGEKRVPAQLFDAPQPVVRAFLDAYVTGDGHRFANGKVSVTTISRELAWGIAWLVLKLGYMPALYDTPMSSDGIVQNRQVRRAAHQYTVVWYEQYNFPRKLVETDSYYLVPLRQVEKLHFDGWVYNMEVEAEHNYLAGLFLVSNCQNWLSSQVLRDPQANESIGYVRRASPEQIVAAGKRAGAGIVASSYNEPLITSEWAVAIFRQALQAGMKCVYVSNGNATPEVLAYLRPYLSAYKIDLKTMRDPQYRRLGGVLQNVLDTIRRAHEMGLWVEVVTLVIPGFNDSTEELMDAARYITSVSPDIPWHVTAFHPDYQMTDPPPTSAKTLLRAAEIGQEAGLKYVYAGNLPGRLQSYENTTCPKCQAALIERSGYTIHAYRLTAQGTCPQCGTKIAGLWTDKPEAVRTGGWGMPRLVR